MRIRLVRVLFRALFLLALLAGSTFHQHGLEGRGLKLKLPGNQTNSRVVVESVAENSSAKISHAVDAISSVHPEWWSVIPNMITALATLALAVIGAITATAAIRTLRAIEGQTGELQESISVARTSATAAKASADALIASERAWIDVEFTQYVTIGVVRYRLTAKNHGKTPAQIIAYDIWHGLLIEGTAFSRDKLTTHFNESKHVFIGGGETLTLREDFDLDDLFTTVSGDRAKDQGMAQGAFCIKLSYEDVVSENMDRHAHYTSSVYFCDLFFSTTNRLAQYNKYT